MALLYKEEGEHGKGCKEVWGVFRHPHFEYLPRNVHFQTGHLTNYNKNFKGTTNSTRTPIITITPLRQTTPPPPTATTGTSPLWSHTSRDQEKGLIRFAKPKVLHKSGVIYHFKYPHINCPDAYIGESIRALGERIKEHLQAPSPIHQHSSSTGHPLSPECFNIIHRETQGSSRNIKEAMFICVTDPSLNRNLGKYQLTHLGHHHTGHTNITTQSIQPHPLPSNPPYQDHPKLP